MTIVITGAASMLGRHIVAACQRAEIPHLPLIHRDLDVADLAAVTRGLAHLTDNDSLVNCAGIRPGGDPIAMLQVNALAPHYLALAAARQGFRLIHISTDCVFSGHDRHRAPVMHNTLETPNPRDHYGRTKLAGEPFGAMTTVVRTSFVGPDHGLWHWIANQPQGATVEGWRDAWWSGSTVGVVASELVEIAKVSQVVSKHHTLIHLATAAAVRKAAVVRALVDHLGRADLQFYETGGLPYDRSLAATWPLPAFAFGLGIERRD